MPRPNSKDAILDAVEHIVATRGAAHLTLDAVAQQCGISKGGLMYNFPTKEALIQAMLSRFIDGLDELRARARKELAARDPNELMVEISATLAIPDRGLRAHSGLLAVIANEPSLLRHISKDAQDRFREVVSSCSKAGDAQVLFFAAMGLHFHDLLGMGLISDAQRDRLRDTLLDLAQSGEPISGDSRARTAKSTKHAKNGGRQQ